MKRRASLSDVAAVAKVSIGTVSNVLNEPEKVRPATRERVYEAIRKVGYRRADIVFPAKPSPSPAGDAAIDPGLPLLVSVGYISVDIMARIDVMPHRNDRMTANRITKTLGGPAANVAVAAAALGPPFALEVELATAIGKDADSLWALDKLAQRGVRARAVRSPFRERLSRCIVLVEQNGGRTTINEPLALDREDLISHIPSGPARRRSHLHVEGYHANALSTVLPSLRTSGFRVSLHDTGLPPEQRSPEGFRALISSLDMVFINRRTACRILGRHLPTDGLVRAMAEFISRGDNQTCEVVMALGPEGAAVFPPASDRGFERVEAPAVELVDGTGAGDAFVGAYLAQRLHDAPPHSAAARACVAASLVMTVEGAQERRTSAREIDGLLKEAAM